MKHFIICILLSLSSFSFTQDFHVEIGGDDNGPGTSALPWETIQHAMDNATAGSTVYIHTGIYNERLYMNVDGTVGNPIHFRPFSNDDVTVDGAGLTDNALLEMYDVQHVIVERIKFKNNEQLDAIGILIEGVSDHIRIEGCEISNVNFSTDPNATITSSTNAQALIVYGNEPTHAITDLEIIGNEIFNCRLGFSEGLAVNGNVDGFIVSENKVHDITNIGIDIIGHEGTCSDPNLDQARNGTVINNETYNCLSPYATSAGIYVDGGKNLLIERNKVYNNQWGIEIGCENVGKTTDGITVRNNFVYGNTTAGLACGGFDYPNTGKVTNTIVANNTFFGNDTENDFSGEMYFSYNEGLTITNNIFYATNTNAEMISDENLAAQSQNVSMYNNLWYHPDGDGNVEFTYEGAFYTSLNAFQTGTGFGDASSFADPNLVITGTTPDLHISAGSPAEDYGNATFSNVGMFDIDGGMRLIDGSIDLGADEIDDQLALFELKKSQFTLFPNPARDHFEARMENGEIDEIHILDLNGRVLLKQISNSTKMELTALNSGVYLVRVIHIDGQFSTQKLIIQSCR